IANELVSAGKCSEMDAMLDLWVNTIYNDTQVQGSELGPVVYMRNGTGSPLIGYAELAERWGVSKTTAGRYLCKMKELGYVSTLAFPGTHGTAIYLKKYLSTMFQISDVLVDKDEVAMALNIRVNIADDTSEDSVSEKESGVSKPHTEIILQKVSKILAAQGFPCFSCPQIQYKLLPLSDDCRKAVISTSNLMGVKEYRYSFVISCKNSTELFRFEIQLTSVLPKEG
ncbi:MAG: MarR family transcriptional regulator, partial [Monoglobaceae bacterium]